MARCCSSVGAAIPDIAQPTSLVQIGQIQKVLTQRVFSTGSTKNSMTIATANPNVIASWSSLLSASNGTRVVQTPFLDNPTFEPGGPITFGGGNETRGGIPIIVDEDPTEFTGMFNRMSIAAIKDMKFGFDCEPNLGVYLVNECGDIIGKYDDIDSPTKFYPIPVYNWFVGSRKIGGKTEPDQNMIQFTLPAGWDNDLAIISPTDFDALTDMVSS